VVGFNSESVDEDGDGRDPNPLCSWHERRISGVERSVYDMRGTLSGLSSAFVSLQKWGEGLESRWLQEFGRIAQLTEDNSRDLKLLLSERYTDIEPQLRDELLSLGDYTEGEATGVQDRPAIVFRAKFAEKKAISLEAKVAELEAILRERTRQSERVRADAEAEANRAREEAEKAAEQARISRETALKTNELAVKKWQITAGIILVALTSLAAIGQAILTLFK